MSRAATEIPPAPSAAGAHGKGALFWGLVLGALAAGGVLALLFLHRPAGQFFYPRCTFQSVTGLLCPGCGGLRSVHALLHGRIGDALHCNALFILGVPAFAAWWAWPRKSGRPLVSARVVWILCAIVLAFTVARNIPGEPFVWLTP